MQNRTKIKAQAFIDKYAGKRIIAHNFHEISEINPNFPSWATLKKYGIVVFEYEETLEWCESVLDLRWYKVVTKM